jgi:tetratricopeptide (TPR) repeat protein
MIAPAGVAVPLAPSPTFARALEVARRTREATLVALAFGLPVAFNPSGTLAFEPFKITLIRFAAVIVALTYSVTLWRSPACGAAILASLRSSSVLLASFIYVSTVGLATLFSVSPLQSLLGSYHRLHGLLTLMALMVLAAAVANRSLSRVRLLDWMLVGSVPVCLYALAQHFKLDPVPWLDRTVGPASTTGSPTSLGAYLAMLVPLTLARARTVAPEFPPATTATSGLRSPTAWRYAGLLVLAGLQVSVTLASGVRGALLGLGAGLAVLAVLLLAESVSRQKPRLLLALIGSALVATIAVNIPAAPLDRLRNTSAQIERLTAIGPDEISARERLLIWKAALETWLASDLRLLVGFGPETQTLALEQRFPVELANRLPDLRFDRVHNELLDQLLTMGVLGLLAYLALIGASVKVGWPAMGSGAVPWLPAGLLAAFAAHLVESSFAFASANTLLIFWLGLGMLASPAGPASVEKVHVARAVRWAISAVLAATLLLFLAVAGSPILADLAYTRGLAYGAGEDVIGQATWLRRAAALAPNRDLYPLALGLALADQAKTEPSASRRRVLLAEAEEAIRRAAAQRPIEPYHRFHLGQVLELKADAERLPSAATEAVEAYEEASRLGPKRAVFVDALALGLHRQGRDGEALVRYAAATELDGPNAERAARIGDCWLALGHNDQARASYEAALRLAPRSAPAHAGQAALLHRAGNVEAAVAQARLAARFQSREWRYRETLARLEQEAGHPREALLEARAAARFAPPWERERLRGLIAELRGEVAGRPGNASEALSLPLHANGVLEVGVLLQ